MNTKGIAMLKGLMDRSGHANELLPFLAKNQKERLLNAPPLPAFDPKSLLSNAQWLNSIHFSWLSEILSEYSQTTQSLFLSVLPSSQKQGVQEMLHFNLPEKPTSPLLYPFILDALRRTLQDPDTLDEPYLPPSPLNCLLQIERKHLVQIADFLGLYDLAADLRQVVDKELLGKIYRALSPQQLHFLHYCSKQSIKWVSAKLGLQAWDGSKKQLNHLLHYRGLIRLAKAMHQEDPSFRWHLLHRLDTGRAKIIQKELYQKQDPVLVTYFKNQVIHVAKRYLP